MALRTLRRAPLLAAALLATSAPQLRAQAAPPSPAQVLGYELGERFTPYAGVQQYSRALADASPRVEYRPYGRTNEGRFYYVMEYLDGMDMERLVLGSGPQPPERVIHILTTVDRIGGCPGGDAA